METVLIITLFVLNNLLWMVYKDKRRVSNFSKALSESLPDVKKIFKRKEEKPDLVDPTKISDKELPKKILKSLLK